MYWDVVEVKAGPDYQLFVRFKDGLAGRLQLPREKLTGVLAPLLDVQFFEQVFIDNGAVSWPGEIDLAPDAMYAQITGRLQGPQQPPETNGESVFRRQLRKLYELKDLLVDPSHSDAYFQQFEELLKDPIPFQNFLLWEKELESLDSVAWESLKAKAAPYLVCRDPKRGWQQLFDVLGEASAYSYLKELVGCSKAWYIPESDNQTPDLEGLQDGRRILCEAKTINISDDEVRARRGPTTVRAVDNQLSEGFFRKLDSDIEKAKRQLQSYAPGTAAQHLGRLLQGRISSPDQSTSNEPPSGNQSYRTHRSF